MSTTERMKTTKRPVGRPIETMNTGDTYELAEYLRYNMNERSGMTNQQISEYLGYKKPNIIAMWKLGKTRIPLERLIDLAKLIKVDPERLLGLWFEQYVSMHYSGDTEAARERKSKVKEIAGYFKRVVSKEEMRVVSALREFTDGKVAFSASQLKALAFIAASPENADAALSAMTGRD